MSDRPRPDRRARTSGARASGARASDGRASGARHRDEPRFGDTFAWLLAATSVIGPILLILVAAVSLAYGLIHLFFLR